ncbi:hypothetical protein WG66_017141 [Moniliophthora roreri]|nr:hypothetical protein WG66_017141 [Moniliophthora roreri]
MLPDTLKVHLEISSSFRSLKLNRHVSHSSRSARPPSHENAKLADSIDSFITRLVLGIVRVSIANSIASHSPRLHDLEIAESTSNTSEPTNISGMDQGVESGCNLLWEEKTRIGNQRTDRGGERDG